MKQKAISVLDTTRRLMTPHRILLFSKLDHEMSVCEDNERLDSRRYHDQFILTDELLMIRWGTV